MNRERTTTEHPTLRLLISCPDQPGIIASVSQFLYEHGANIVQSDQYSTHPQHGLFFMRIEFEVTDVESTYPRLIANFPSLAESFQMNFRFERSDVLKRTAIFVSKEPHCLLELLWQWQSGDLQADIALILSNHPDAREIAEQFGIPFHHVPVAKDSKESAEAIQQQILSTSDIDVVILARYMQILSPDFVSTYKNRIINIHHSFLPAFIGRNPYARAYDRGVKLIGATAHYVTSDLDEGPIIEQDVQRVDHRSDAEALRRIGRHVERTVLARAVKWHLEDRVLVHENKTIVFS